jgi:hypothetical protein
VPNSDEFGFRQISRRRLGLKTGHKFETNEFKYAQIWRQSANEIEMAIRSILPPKAAKPFEIRSFSVPGQE